MEQKARVLMVQELEFEVSYVNGGVYSARNGRKESSSQGGLIEWRE
jgi:hypothetical protein